MNKQIPYDGAAVEDLLRNKIIQDINDSLVCIIQDVLIEMEYSLQDNIKVNTLDIGLLPIDNNDAEFQYYEKMIRIVNLIIIKFNETNDFKCKVYHMNELYSIIYAKDN